MAHPFLKSIKPVNLLSFGPNTEEIELRPLNILIGPNGSGKSNFTEVVRLLHFLPDKDPWDFVLASGGATEWVWRGGKKPVQKCCIATAFSLGDVISGHSISSPRQLDLSIELETYQSSFRVSREVIGTTNDDGERDSLFSWFERSGSVGGVHHRNRPSNAGPIQFDVTFDRSILAQLSSPQLQAYGISEALPELFEVKEFFEAIDIHQDWEFGADLTARDPMAAGQRVERLEEDGSNLAQMLAYFRDYHRPVFDQIGDYMKKFYEPFKSLEIRVIGTHLQIAILEEGGFATSAYRLSDGTLRWLAVLAVLLNPNPAPVICIDEPELGLHPDILPILADLLVDASTRTQLIITTHSRSFLDSFTDNPDAVCVCEKIEGSTVIQRLNKDDLKVWLDEYALGKLWTSGQIGGNRS